MNDSSCHLYVEKKDTDKSQSSDITILNVQYSISDNKYFKTDHINEQYLHLKHDPRMGNKLALYSHISLFT